MAEYKDIYEKWDEFHSCRVRISPRNEGENLWGRVIPGVGVGIDSNPLAPELRWQDIVDPKSTKYGLPKLLHRRWNVQIHFKYQHLETEAADFPRREKIFMAVKAVGGHASFFLPGIGFILMEEKKDALEKVEGALKGLEFVERIDLQDDNQ